MATIAAVLAFPARPALAQMVLAQQNCAGSYLDTEIKGTVLADLWFFSVTPGRIDVVKLRRFFKLGELDKIPGTVRLFGHMQDANNRLVNFEVFLTGQDRGTGSVWINGARHRETYMQLVLKNGGFDIFPETGGVASFTCER